MERIQNKRRRFLMPDAMIAGVYALSPEHLADNGIRGVVFDIDNTLAPYGVAVPDEKLREFLRAFERCGIRVALVSNNNEQRVKIFNETLGLFAVWNAGKPLGRGLKRCIQHLGVGKSEILVVGDQIFTDCLAAHCNGVRCFVVPPIEPRENAFFKFKRILERPVVRLYERGAYDKKIK